MKKEGFTLVELLAVIAILAILVIIALPNVLRMFNNAKESTFETEVKEIASTAQKQWLKDSITNSGAKVYTSCTEKTCENPLDIIAKDSLEYYVHMDSSGKIDQLYVKDDSFQYGNNGEFDINNVTGVEKVSDVTDDKKIEIKDNKVTVGGVEVAINNGESSGEEETIPDGMVCIRAKTLHTATCEYTDAQNYCSGEGYTTDGGYGTTSIVFGSLGTKGTLKSGDAFDCDVNADGVYDPSTERFYYVSDYYNTHTKSFDSSYATLIYYSNYASGGPNNSNRYAYDSGNRNTRGPISCYNQLPTTSQWPNVSLKETTRQLLTFKTTTETTGGTLPEFNYSGKAARLLTAQEAAKAVNKNSSRIGDFYFINGASYFMENTNYSSSSISSAGYWMESAAPTYSNRACFMYGRYRHCNSMATRATDQGGVRPAIEVPKSKIYY